ncbi:P-loop containing nucleoside triphosphate hydrolase protein [Baffinella frigidus]|nr:P-loop containing nucleoside triphosphate hydrolase protein [Cryptophyta sp. CCMP2293]
MSIIGNGLKGFATGSGKTLAFLLPIVHSLLEAAPPPGSPKSTGPPACLILAPSRDLAMQIFRVADSLLQGSTLSASQAIGGANPERQVEALRKQKPAIVVGTPGRVAELGIKQSKLNLGSIKYLVVDEADQCLATRLAGDVEPILAKIAKTRRQTVFATATGNTPQMIAFAKQHFRSAPVMLSLGNERLPPQLQHVVIPCQRIKRLEVLRSVFFMDDVKGEALNPGGGDWLLTGVLVFVNDAHAVDVACTQLELLGLIAAPLKLLGLIAAPLKGDTERDDRKEIMRRLRESRLGDKPLVVATEMAARGIDIPDFSHVVNFDLPTDGAHYVHRAGRTARAGRAGTAITLCPPSNLFVMGKFAAELGIEFRAADVYDGGLRYEDEAEVEE